MAQGLPPLSHQADGNVTSGADGEIFFLESSIFFSLVFKGGGGDRGPRHLLIQTVSPQTLSHLKCRPADRGGATDTKLSSFFLEFV